MPLLDQPVIAPLGGDLFAEQLARLPDGEVADVDDLLDLAARLAEDLAVLQADEPCEILLAGPEPIAQPAHYLAALRSGHKPPPHESVLRLRGRAPPGRRAGR